MEKQNAPARTKTPEDAATVGMFLRYSRLNQKKTVDQVAKVLCIRKVYIKAIEESNFNELAPIPYGIGFVRSYAQYLGLNAERIVQCYKEEAFPKKNVEKLKNSTPGSVHPATLKPAWKHVLLGLLAVAALCVLWFVLFNETTVTVPEVEDATPAMETTVEDDEAFVDPMDAVEDESAENEAVEEESTARINIKLNGESWLEVRDDDRIYLTGTYPEGFTYEVPEGNGMRLSIGKRLNVEVYVDGVLTPVARPGRQVNIPLDEYLKH